MLPEPQFFVLGLSFFPAPGHLWASSFQGLFPLRSWLSSPQLCVSGSQASPLCTCFLIWEVGNHSISSHGFWKPAAQGLAGVGTYLSWSTSFPARSAHSSPLPDSPFPPIPQPSQRWGFVLPYFREMICIVVDMGTQADSFQKVMERGPWESGLSLTVCAPGPCPEQSGGRRLVH